MRAIERARCAPGAGLPSRLIASWNPPRDRSAPTSHHSGKASRNNQRRSAAASLAMSFMRPPVAGKGRGTFAELFAAHRFPQVVHLAAQAGVRHSLTDPHAYADANLTGFLNVLEGCRHAGCRHLVYASSSSVYGANTRVPFRATDNVDHPVSFYGATKKANELMAHAYAHLFALPATGLRFFTVYGPWGRPDT